MADDLLLQVRLAALETNLKRVRTLAATLRANSETLSRLYRLLAETSDLRTQLARTRTLLTNLTQYAEEDERLRSALERFDLMAPLIVQSTKLLPLVPALKQAASELNEMRLHAEEAASLLPEDQVNEVFEHTGKLLLAVGKLRQKVAAGPPGPAHWDEFRCLLRQEELSVFGDYVDVAGGLTLRGIGLDEQFCAMADALAAQWNGVVPVKTPLFSIPGRSEATRVSGFIRMGFPEWSIWAVPLFACEFGRILVGQDEELERFARDTAPRLGSDVSGARAQDRVRVYLADAFATYVMGPAYAYASLLLKLDATGGTASMPSGVTAPAPASSGQSGAPPDDTVRAAVTLQALMRSGQRANGQLVVAAKQLSEVWSSALEQFGTPPVPPDDELVTKVVDRALTALAGMDELSNRRLHFDDTAWAKAQEKAAVLFPSTASAGSSDRTEPQPPADPAASKVPPAQVPPLPLQDVALPHVLNAAWYARVSDPEVTDQVAELVTRRVWPELKKMREGRGGRVELAEPVL